MLFVKLPTVKSLIKPKSSHNFILVSDSSITKSWERLYGTAWGSLGNSVHSGKTWVWCGSESTTFLWRMILDILWKNAWWSTIIDILISKMYTKWVLYVHINMVMVDVYYLELVLKMGYLMIDILPCLNTSSFELNKCCPNWG